MIPRPPTPVRPTPKSKRARSVVEWAEVSYYVFWLAFWPAIVVMSLLHYGPDALQLIAG